MRLKLRPATVLQASNDALSPRRGLLVGLVPETFLKGLSEWPGTTAMERERQVSGSFPGRSAMREGCGGAR